MCASDLTAGRGFQRAALRGAVNSRRCRFVEAEAVRADAVEKRAAASVKNAAEAEQGSSYNSRGSR